MTSSSPTLLNRSCGLDSLFLHPQFVLSWSVHQIGFFISGHSTFCVSPPKNRLFPFGLANYPDFISSKPSLSISLKIPKPLLLASLLKIPISNLFSVYCRFNQYFVNLLFKSHQWHSICFSCNCLF